MRHLVLLLVLSNLAFAAWHAWFAEPPSVLPPAPSQPDLAGIVLVSELVDVPAGVVSVDAGAAPSAALVTGAAEEAPRIAGADAAAGGVVAADLAASAAPAPVELRCISVGPFRELSQAATAAATLRGAGHAPEQRVVEGDIWVGYWVYLPGIATRERADELLVLLQQQGMTDSYVIPGDAGYLISLGVFSEISRAGTRREQVRALGQEPVVVDRTRRGTVYWIDLSLPPSQALDLEALQMPGRITRLEQRNCGTGP